MEKTLSYKGNYKHQNNVICIERVPTLSTNNDKEKIIGSIYIGKSDKFGCGVVDRDISHTILTGGESAIILRY